MQEGSFRCDANVSIRPRGQEELGTRAELKNLNSFRFVEKAINFEIERQIDVIEDGGEVVQETRLYDSDKDETRSMRSKEEANDYRYFPGPDLLPVEISPEYIEAVRETLPELPDAKQQRFVDDYGIRADDAAILTASRALADYFEVVAGATQGNAQGVANLVGSHESATYGPNYHAESDQFEECDQHSLRMNAAIVAATTLDGYWPDLVNSNILFALS